MQRNLFIIAFIIIISSFFPGSYAASHLYKSGIIFNEPPVIIVGPVLGSISACVGSPSSAPYLNQFSVSGSDLTGNITATAPAGFEISLNSTSGFGPGITINENSLLSTVITVYVRSAAAGQSGDIIGNITLSSPGATDVQVPVSGVIIAPVTVDPVNPQVFLNGTTTTPINFTGSANTFTWTNDTPTIGLAASGNGNIPSFTATNTGTSPVTATITVTPSYTRYVYIANSGSNDVSVISTTTNAVINTITVGKKPYCIATSPYGTRAYVSNTSDGTVSVINTNNLLATINVQSNPLGISVSPDGNYAFVANAGSNTISVINTVTSQVQTTINVGSYPTYTAISPNGALLYVVNQKDNTISVINTSNNTLNKLLNVEQEPGVIALSSDGKTLYYTKEGSPGALVAVNIATNTQIAALSLSSQPGAITLSADGSKIYLTNPAENTVSVINASTLQVITKIHVGNNPVGLSTSADDQLLYVADNTSHGETSVINTATDKLITTVNVGTNPVSIGNFGTKGPGCDGPPMKFTITVEPSPKIIVSGTLIPLSTTYGVPSSSTTFIVSGLNMTNGILVTPPPGFEVSSDGVNFSATLTVGTKGSIPPTVVYIRLAATTDVGTYSGNIALSSKDAASVNESMPNSMVNAAKLTIAANSVTKIYGTTLTGGPGSTEFTVTGLENNETAGSVTMTYGKGADAADPVAIYSNSVVPSALTGGTAKAIDYVYSYVDNEIDVETATLTITADNKTRLFGKPNPLLTASYSGFVNGDGPEQLSALPVLSTIATITYAPGQYPIIIGGASSQNYVINYIQGILTIQPLPQPLIIPNAFTPNGDGINDTWLITHIDEYPNCYVQVFNRYGQKMYSSIGYPIPWDGKYKNSYLSTGTYYYIIDLKNGSGVLAGSVMIIR